MKKEKGNINNYWISAAAAMLASCTRIVGVILVFPLVLQMYLDLYEGRITFGKLGSFIVHMFKNPVKILQVFLCPAGIFVNMMHLYYVTGDAWAFRNVQAAWREERERGISRMKGLLKFITCGSVDDGKSTLIGHILYDAKLLYADQEKALELDSKVGSRGGAIDYSLLLDGLMAEREQGITIDVAYRYFTTDNRSFIVADTPGHEEYTRNMAYAALDSDTAIIMIAVIGGTIYLVKDVVQLMMNYPTSRDIYKFVGVAFNLVICIEFVKMLCKHTPDTLVEVMMFAIARQMIVEHTSPQQNLIVVLAIAILFTIKKFFFGKFDDIDKTVFLPTQRISSINELVHVEIPKETQHQTLGELLEKRIGTESGNFQVGQCYFFEGGALRVAKVKNGKITQIEVIRSKNAPVVLKR